MATEYFVFKPDPSVSDIAHVLATPRGLEAFEQIATEFHSLAGIIAHTRPYDHGTGTEINLPDRRNHIVLENLTEGEIVADARKLGHLLLG